VEDDEQEAIWRFECQLRLKFDFNGTIIQWGLNCHANTITNCCKVCLWQAYGVVLWTTCMAWIEVYCVGIFPWKRQIHITICLQAQIWQALIKASWLTSFNYSKIFWIVRYECVHHVHFYTTIYLWWIFVILWEKVKFLIGFILFFLSKQTFMNNNVF
jgi:hypothetical protein